MIWIPFIGFAIYLYKIEKCYKDIENNKNANLEDVLTPGMFGWWSLYHVLSSMAIAVILLRIYLYG